MIFSIDIVNKTQPPLTLENRPEVATLVVWLNVDLGSGLN